MRFKLYSIIVVAVLLASCANRGVGPQGGPKDSIPPVVRLCEPQMGQLNFTGKRIEVTFDEYIQLDNVASNMMMSPPQQNPPDVKARGKKLIVQFQDTLYPNTTYTIDFGSAVCDYREKTPLRGFSYYFSTGEEIDTLQTYGRVYDAQTLNPVKGITVGIYSNMSDTAFERHPFLRIAKTDSSGGFTIKNIHPGSYRIYGVDDISRDYRLTVGESLAFADEPITVQAPVAETPVVDTTAIAAIDSTATDSATVIDSIPHTHVEPDLLLTHLFLFKEEQQKLYLQRALREEQHRIKFLFSSTPDSLPIIRPLCDSLNFHVQYSPKRDTVSIWLTDSMSIKQDSLFWEIKYRQTDSVYNLVWALDTLRTIWRAPKLSAQAQRAQERANKMRRLTIATNARKGFEIYDTLRINCTTPLASINDSLIELVEMKDSIATPVYFAFEPHDTLPMSLQLLAKIKPEGVYELRIDSGALHDIYGITHIKGTYSFQVKAVSDYSTLRVKLIPFEPQARIQLLDTKDNVLRELPAAEEGAFFEYLKPDSYYMRLYIDSNNDGKWTTGSWAEKRQPEQVWYFPQKIQTKSNWDFEEEWDYKAVEQAKSKPRELIKVQGGKK